MPLSSQTHLQDVRSLKPDGDGGLTVESLESLPAWDLEDRLRFPPALSKTRQASKTRQGRIPSKMRRHTGELPKPGFEFQLLVEKLVHAHMLEVEAARGHGSEASHSVPLGAPLGQAISQTTSQMEPTQLSPSMAALLKMQKKRSSEHSTSSVTAEKILQAWDEEDSLSQSEPPSPLGLDKALQSLPDAKGHPESKSPLTECVLSSAYELAMSLLVLANTAWMAVMLQVEGDIIGPAIRGQEEGFQDAVAMWKDAFMIGDTVFAAIFVVEVCFRISVLGRRFCMSCLVAQRCPFPTFMA